MRFVKSVRFVVFLSLALVATGCVSVKGHAPERGVAMAPAPKAPKQPASWILLPAPRKIHIVTPAHAFALPEGPITIEKIETLPKDQIGPVRKALKQAARALPFDGGPCKTPKMTAVISAKSMPHPQGYRLTLNHAGVKITAHDGPGLFYAAQTLRQIGERARANGVIPKIRITDWPDFPHRGVMLDVARCKVPQMETLYALVDKFASWKLNQLQLYTEHTFAYRGAHVVWEDASPMTSYQIRELDKYCRNRFIELVPNQNSFGHMGRWLQHAKYKHLAEMPGGGSDLCPVDPDCVKFLAGLYNDLLPNFSSHQFNVGCDETASIGKGRSKAAVKAEGVGQVYLDFLLKIHALVAQHGKRMQFWGDIIMNHKNLIPKLPKDVIAMEWGYDANHPFLARGKVFAKAGISYYVVPGTSSWNSLVGRTDNAVANLRNAAEGGLADGAIGYLITDWGDGGHWQFLPVSYLGFTYGAAVSWCVKTNVNADIPRLLDTYAFEDSAGVMGKLAYDLGNAYLKTGITPGNDTTFYGLLQHDVEKPLSKSFLKPLTVANLEATLDYVDRVMAALPKAKMNTPDAQLICDEFTTGANLVRFACHLGIARVQAGGVATSALPNEAKRKLAAELAPIIPQYRQLWLARNRCGGLKESAGHMENLLALLAVK